MSQRMRPRNMMLSGSETPYRSVIDRGKSEFDSTSDVAYLGQQNVGAYVIFLLQYDIYMHVMFHHNPIKLSLANA
jgi:hypothetical protein